MLNIELNVIYNEDCLLGMQKLPAKSIDLIITEPPYDSTTSNYNVRTFGAEFVRIMKEINIYVWCSKEQLVDYFDFYINQNNCKFEMLNLNAINSSFTSLNKRLIEPEYLLYFSGGVLRSFPNEYNKSDSNNKVDIVERIIKTSSRAGDVILDPFLGNGETAIACLNQNRNYVGYEIDEGQFNITDGLISTHKLNLI